MNPDELIINYPKW